MYEFMSDIKKVDLGGGASIYIYIYIVLYLKKVGPGGGAEHIYTYRCSSNKDISIYPGSDLEPGIFIYFPIRSESSKSRGTPLKFNMVHLKIIPWKRRYRTWEASIKFPVDHESYPSNGHT